MARIGRLTFLPQVSRMALLNAIFSFGFNSSGKALASSIMSENPYQAPPDAESSPRAPFRSRAHAAAMGALSGMCFTAKWTTLIAGPLLALPALALSGWALFRWWSAGANIDRLLLLALNLVMLVGAGILQLFVWMVMFSLLGAAIQALREAVRFKCSCHAAPCRESE